MNDYFIIIAIKMLECKQLMMSRNNGRERKPADSRKPVSGFVIQGMQGTGIIQFREGR